MGRKILYLKRDEYYHWKIVDEIWTKAGLEEDSSKSEEKIAFRPSMRFFNSTNPETILGHQVDVHTEHN